MSGRVKGNENIQVYVRCRPTNNRERSIHSNEIVKVPSDREVVVKQMMDNRMTKKFTFDRAFGPESKQSDVYEAVVAPLINEVLSGYNCTVFAYGQTGTGKTHTMIGHESLQTCLSYEDSTEMGIIPRALCHLFEELRLMGVEFSMRVSYLELYNEELSDLLSSSDITQIRIFEDPNKKGSIIVQGLEEIPVHNTGDVYKLLAKGQDKRKMAATLMNAQSSRSHTIFSILVHIKENGIDGEELVKIGKLNLVDLAGSENISKAGNEKGIRARETVNINQSLLTLGRVITALVERTPHIPYRESKLTRLLQESLGGRTKTSIIATVSPGHKDLEETMSTLEYANRAKNIQNKPEINQKLTKKTVLKEYTEEIDRLKRDLMAARDKNGIFLAEETYNQMQYQIDSQNKEITDQINKLKAHKDELANKQQAMNEINVELIKRTEELKNTEAVLGETEEVLEKTKRGYQEKKQILLKHMKTEEVLTTQARQLMEVANTATKDVTKLHDTITRRKEHDQGNREACKKLDVNMNSHLSAMDNNLQAYTSTFSGHVVTLIEKLNSNTHQSKTVCASLITNIKLLIEIEDQAKTTINELATNNRAELSDMFAEHTETNNEILNGAMETRKELSDQIDILFQFLVNAFEAYERDHTHLKELVRKNSDTVNDFCGSHSGKLNLNFNHTIDALQGNASTLTETSSSTMAINSNMINLLDQIRDLVDKSNRFSETAKGVSDGLRLQGTRIQNELEQNLADINDFKCKMSDEISAFDSKLTECDVTMKTINTNVHEMMDVNKQKEEKLLTTLNEIDATYTEHKKGVSDKVDDFFREVVDTFEMTKINIDGGLNHLIDDVSHEQEHIDAAHQDMNEIVSNMESVQTEYMQTMSNDIDICANRLNEFQNSDLKIYTPTGQTPSKRNFVYPTTLAATSPHAKIVRDFWHTHNPEDLNCSAIIPEESRNSNLENSSNQTENTLVDNAAFLETDGNHTMDTTDTTIINNTANSIAGRTLCENPQMIYSTPIVPNNIRKPLPMQNISNLDLNGIQEEDKEN